MLATTSDQGFIQSHAISEGLSDAGLHDAKPAKVNPAWAAQTMLAAHRVAKLPDKQILMAEVFRDTRFPHQPTRKTLSDTIRLLAATGNVTADQGRWLTDNKGYPNRLWSATGYLSGQAANDPNAAILKSLCSSLPELAPIKDIARFVTAWARELPGVIDPQLVYEIRNLARQQRDPETFHDVNWEAFNQTLAQTVSNITTELNRRMEPNPSLTMNGQSIDLTLTFGYDVQPTGALAIGADHSMGIEIGFDPLSLNPDYWNGLKAAIVLIQKHLFPIETTVDLVEMSGMMIEEAEEDLATISSYLVHHDLENTEGNVEAAIEQAHILQVYMCVVEDYSAYEHFSSEVAMREETLDNWKSKEPASIAGLAAITAALPKTGNAQESRLAVWLNEVVGALAGKDDDTPWWESLNHSIADDCCGNLHSLDELTPVYCEDDQVAGKAARDRHDCFMEGGEEEGPVRFVWNTNPKELLDFADTLNVGYTLLRKLLIAGYE